MNPLAAAKPLDEAARAAALARQAQLTKPPGSLGQLEALATTLAAMQGRALPRIAAMDQFLPPTTASRGRSAFPQASPANARICRRGAAISVRARQPARG
jgi:nicotinate-nucleotide--dimethylbenzimidazole phosphoribosyltransferase